MKQRILVFLLVVMLVGVPVFGQEGAAFEPALSSALQYLQTNVPQPVIASIGGDWTVFSLARAGLASSDYGDQYEQAVLQALEEVGSNQLHPFKSTENARVALALAALGKNPRQIGSFDVVQPLCELSYAEEQGINAVSYALLVLHVCDVEASVREPFIQWILERELEHGGWSLSGNEPEADVTAMVLQVLSFDKKEEAVATVIDRGLEALSRLQGENGGFSNLGIENSESCAQVLCALCTLGISPEEEGFIKNGSSVLDALLSYYDSSSGGFCHTVQGGVNLMATEQASYALTAYRRFLTGQPGLYDMSDTEHKSVTLRMEGAQECIYQGEAEFVFRCSVSELLAKMGEQGTIVWPQEAEGPGEWKCRIDGTVYRLEEGILFGGERVEVFYGTSDMRFPQVDLTKLNSEGKILFTDDLGPIPDLEVMLGEQKGMTDQDGAVVFPNLQKGVYLLQVSQYSSEGVPKILRLPKGTAVTVEPEPDKEPEESGSGGSGSETIRVSFRLIGATKADGKIDLSNGNYCSSEYVTWVPTSLFLLKEGSTVGDLLEQALKKNRLSYKGLNDNYISSITAPKACGGYSLAEFDNGAYSGWMFMVNGTAPAVGLNNVYLNNGDRVIWHYVNDYRHESEASGAFYQSWLKAADVAPSKSTVSEETKTPSPSVTPTSTSILSPSPTPSKEPEENLVRFLDVNQEDWYYTSVSFVVTRGWMYGVSDALFDPDGIMNRAMLVTILYRLAGQPEPQTRCSFSDVEPESWYEKAVCWGAEQKLVSGYGDGLFGPADELTREQLASILFRYKGNDKKNEKLSGFSDVEELSSYAYEGMAWAVEEGLLLGWEENLLAPKQPVTRCQTAAILMRGEAIFGE